MRIRIEGVLRGRWSAYPQRKLKTRGAREMNSYTCEKDSELAAGGEGVCCKDYAGGLGQEL